MELKNKKTTLTDDAELYSHKTDKMTTKEKWQSLDKKGKWEFFKNYYLLKVICIIAGGGLVFSILFTILKPKPETVLNFTVTDMLMNDTEVDVLNNDFLDKLGLDKENYTVTMNRNISFLTDGMNSAESYTIFFAARELDVTIMPLKAFKDRAPYGFFLNVDEYLSEEDMNKFGDRLVYAERYDETDNVIPDSYKAYGIIVEDCPYISGNFYPEPIVFVVNSCSKHLDNAKLMAEFLFK